MCQQPFHVCPTCGTMTQGTTEPCSNPSSTSCLNPCNHKILPPPAEHNCERCLRRLQGHPDCGPGGKFPRGCWGEFWKALASPAKASNVKLTAPKPAKTSNLEKGVASTVSVLPNTVDNLAPLSSKTSTRTRSGRTPAAIRLNVSKSMEGARHSRFLYDERVASSLRPSERRSLRPREHGAHKGQLQPTTEPDTSGRSKVTGTRKELKFHLRQRKSSRQHR